MGRRLIALVYAGARMLDGALVHVYAPVVDGKLSDSAVAFASPLDDHPVGTHAERPGSGKSVDIGPERVLGQWPDAMVVADWVVQHSATMAAQLPTADTPGIHAICAPMRAAYLALDDEGRQMLIAQVVRSVVEPPE